MALAQSQPARMYGRAAARAVYPAAVRPTSRPLRTARARMNWRAYLVPVLLSGVLAGVLVAYLTGYALMTGANYQKVRLTRELADLQARNQLLSTQVIEKKEKDRIEAWARARGLVKPNRASFYVGSAMRGERQVR